MNPVRPLQSASRTPRRRLRPTPLSRDPSLPSAHPPSRDLIGPPCPLSNLRPVYYAPLFPSLHSPSSWSASPPSSSPARTTSHPYSLSEFASTSLSSSRDPAQQRLQRLKHQLHAQDLEWRLTRYRLDAFNQAFWARMNTAFLRARDEYLSRGSDGAEWSDGTGTAAQQMTEDVDLAPFYKEHLERTKKEYASYNWELWRMQAGLLWPAVKAAGRRWRWKAEVWRAGGEKL
ncbi:SPOSA6832_01471, partial [Sporobolomyces salmonicolor]